MSPASVFLTSANVANIMSGRKYCQTIITTHVALSRSPLLQKKPFILRLLGIIFDKADLHIAVSQGVRRDLIEAIGCETHKIRVVYNGIDVDAIRNCSLLKECVGRECFDLVTMGRVATQKHQWHLIRCVHELKKRHHTIKCLIIGAGPLDGYFRRLIKDGGLEDNVCLSGFVDNPFPLLRKGKVFVLPSGYEGFGNAAVEAMALGLPCVLTDYRYGAREIIAPDMDINAELADHIEFCKYGILTPVCSGTKHEIDTPLSQGEILLCEAIEAMMEPEIYNQYRQASIKHAKDFGLEGIVPRWIELIAEGNAPKIVKT